MLLVCGWVGELKAPSYLTIFCIPFPEYIMVGGWSFAAGLFGVVCYSHA